MLKNHPKALPYLFFSEMWERFGYYLMIGIFTFYLKDAATGFAMTEAESADLYGTFIALVFLTPFFGGLIADRYLGYDKSIILGGVLMGIGYCLMAIHSLPVLYFSMSLVIIGNGFFKPNISTVLGNIYNSPNYIDKKDLGYNIFYMGINIGAFICNFFGAAMQNIWGWGYAFLAAGVGMFIGVVIFIIGKKHYGNSIDKKGIQANDMPFTKIIYLIILPALIFGIIGWLMPFHIFDQKTKSTDAFIFGCIPIIYFYINLFIKANKNDKRPVAALLAIFAVVVLFWAVFKQNGSALNTWGDNYTNRQVSGATADNLKSLFQAKEFTYKLDSVDKKDGQFRITKNGKNVIKEFGYPNYFKNVTTENKPSDGAKYTLWSPNLTQSINPFWVIVLTPVVVAFFALLKRRKKEPSTATKITLGLFISALSALVMVAAVYASQNGANKVSVLWLFGCYGVITIGELFLSPMGLSIVSKLSPTNITSLMMGGWFLATSIGNKLSGVLASLWDGYENKANFFYVNCILLIIATISMVLILKWLNKILKEKGIN